MSKTLHRQEKIQQILALKMLWSLLCDSSADGFVTSALYRIIGRAGYPEKLNFGCRRAVHASYCRIVADMHFRLAMMRWAVDRKVVLTAV